MRLGELWWSRLVNSVRFLDDVKDAIDSCPTGAIEEDE